MKVTNLKWITSNGGPLLLLEENLVHQWKGSMGNQHDYQRACEIQGYLGIIVVEEGTGLVLGDAPFPTAWQPNEDKNGGVIIRWGYASSESDVISSLLSLADQSYRLENFTIEFLSDSQIVFDSAYSGEELDEIGEEILEMHLPKGRYQVETANFKPDNEMFLVIHRLSKAV